MSFAPILGAFTDESRRFSWWDVALILLLGLILIGSGIGLRDPWPADEPRFALIARDMVLSGEWFFPKVGGVFYPDKPPVFFWLIALFYKLTGSLRVAFLLPSLLASLGVLILINDLGRRLWSRGVGLTAAVLLLFTFQFTNSAKVAQIDMLLCFWITLSTYCFARHLLVSPNWRLYYLGFIAAGLGVITKGVGFLPVFIFLPFSILLILGWNPVRHSLNWRWLLGPVLFLLAVSFWLGPLLLIVQNSTDTALQSYRDNILFKQTADRYTNAWDHREPAWYFFTSVIPAMWLPLSLTLPWLIPAWFNKIKEKDQATILLLSWVVCVLIFFSVASGKRGVYILSVLPIVALLAAPHIRLLVKNRWVGRLLLLALVIFGLTLISLNVYFTLIKPEKGLALVSQYKIIPWAYLMTLGGLALLISALARVRYSWAGWLGFLSCFWLIASLWVYPNINHIRSGSAFVQNIEKNLAPNKTLAIVGWKEQFLLYFKRPIHHFGYRRYKEKLQTLASGQIQLPSSLEAITWLNKDSNRVILISDRLLGDCFIADEGKVAGFTTRSSWYLLTSNEVKEECKGQGIDSKGFTYLSDAGRLAP